MKRLIALLFVFTTCLVYAEESKATTELDRTVLPIAEPKPPVYTELDVRNATPL